MDTAKDAYNAVGGLDKQITQVRDLIEIPLTRPELFRHFGVFGLTIWGYTKLEFFSLTCRSSPSARDTIARASRDR